MAARFGATTLLMNALILLDRRGLLAVRVAGLVMFRSAGNARNAVSGAALLVGIAFLSAGANSAPTSTGA